MIVFGVSMLLFFRHWVGALEVQEEMDALQGLRALWGGVFTVLSFLSTTGFQSTFWAESQQWSGLGTPGLILMGLALIGGMGMRVAGGEAIFEIRDLTLSNPSGAEDLWGIGGGVGGVAVVLGYRLVY